MSEFLVTLNVTRIGSAQTRIKARSKAEARKKMEKLWDDGELDESLAEETTVDHSFEVKNETRLER